MPRFPILPGLLAALAVSGCVTVQPDGAELVASSPTFDPAAFFAGRTEGVGVIRRQLKDPAQIIVHGTGRAADDRLMLTQQILIEGSPPEMRTFTLRRTAPNRWKGRLTGTDGWVVAQAHGNTLAIRYRTDRGFRVDQRLYLQPDGRTALNRTAITQFGVGFARIEETIRRLD